MIQVTRLPMTINVGTDLKRELKRIAREENGDATWLARRVLRAYVNGPRRPSCYRDANGTLGTRPSGTA